MKTMSETIPTIEQMLDALANEKSRRDCYIMDKQKLIDEAIPAEVKQAIAEIEGEYALITAAADEIINDLEAQVKAAVLSGKKTERGQYLMAVYTKGRSGGYDTQKLDGMAAIIPQILQAKKPDGEPTVSIRSIGK